MEKKSNQNAKQQNALSEDILKDNLLHLSANWNVNRKNVPGNLRNPLKVMFHKMLQILSKKLTEPFMEQQSMFNLKVTSTLQELCRDKKTGRYFACFDDLMEENLCLDILLTFHYYNRNMEPDSHLYFIPDKIGSNEYLLCILDAVNELSIRNVHFLLNVGKTTKATAREEADVLLSYRKHRSVDLPEETDPNQYSVILSEEGVTTNRKNILIVNELDVERIACSIQAMVSGGCSEKDGLE